MTEKVHIHNHTHEINGNPIDVFTSTIRELLTNQCMKSMSFAFNISRCDFIDYSNYQKYSQRMFVHVLSRLFTLGSKIRNIQCRFCCLLWIYSSRSNTSKSDRLSHRKLSISSNAIVIIKSDEKMASGITSHSKSYIESFKQTSSSRQTIIRRSAYRE